MDSGYGQLFGEVQLQMKAEKRGRGWVGTQAQRVFFK